MSPRLVNLSDRDLFGNEAAEDEDEDIFSSYAYERPELEGFTDPFRKLCFVRAYKGEGKSALLRMTEQRIRTLYPAALVISGRNPQFSPSRTDADFDRWVVDWKATIIGQVAQSVGSKLNVAMDDATMSLVELADKNGVRDRGIVSALLARFPKVTARFKSVEVDLAAQAAPTDPELAVRRWAEGREAIWIVVDDVDQNFANDPRHRTKVAAFFTACRQLASSVPEFRIRAAVRPNVWTTIKHEFESLSHVEQYITNLEWSESSIRAVLARRVQGYLVRRAKWQGVADELPTDTAQRERKLISFIFDDPMEWGSRPRPPHVLLHTLSKHRPRWVVELCSAATGLTAQTHRQRVAVDDILAQLEEFGRRRVEDTVAEFKSQCPQVGEIIGALKQGQEEYSTDELVRHLNHHVMNHLTPRISGVVGDASALDVAAFLYEIGVIFGRRDLPTGYQHVGFSEQPSLLRSRTNLDDGLRWEVHPVFRQVLGLRDSYGKERQRTQRRRTVKRRPPN